MITSLDTPLSQTRLQNKTDDERRQFAVKIHNKSSSKSKNIKVLWMVASQNKFQPENYVAKGSSIVFEDYVLLHVASVRNDDSYYVRIYGIDKDTAADTVKVYTQPTNSDDAQIELICDDARLQTVIENAFDKSRRYLNCVKDCAKMQGYACMKDFNPLERELEREFTEQKEKFNDSLMIYMLNRGDKVQVSDNKSEWKDGIISKFNDRGNPVIEVEGSEYNNWIYLRESPEGGQNR